MRAVTRVANDATRQLDLNDIARGDGFLFVRDGVGFAGRGVAARVPFDDAPAALADIERIDETGLDATTNGGSRAGRGPIGLGWVPFRPGLPGEVVIPRVVVAKSTGGACWVTIIDGPGIDGPGIDDTGESLASPTPPMPAADAYTIDQVTPTHVYLAAVEAA